MSCYEKSVFVVIKNVITLRSYAGVVTRGERVYCFMKSVSAWRISEGLKMSYRFCFQIKTAVLPFTHTLTHNNKTIENLTFTSTELFGLQLHPTSTQKRTHLFAVCNQIHSLQLHFWWRFVNKSAKNRESTRTSSQKDGDWLTNTLMIQWLLMWGGSHKTLVLISCGCKKNVLFVNRLNTSCIFKRNLKRLTFFESRYSKLCFLFSLFSYVRICLFAIDWHILVAGRTG